MIYVLITMFVWSRRSSSNQRGEGRGVMEKQLYNKTNAICQLILYKLCASSCQFYSAASTNTEFWMG
ncbi:hypothetical protein BRADI_3g22403v3 [Brachypodium distachyon]|uniref:Uncharacterized protein n=1 Tax=Brachypodium distachyon TaxID=15368 RepID=A0A0Q3I743_BRADI|nr:hypothetical protein BRADI_3g22403v3 [Brachypodium distachyon]